MDAPGSHGGTPLSKHDAGTIEACEKQFGETKAKFAGLILEEWKESRGDVTKTMVIEWFHGLRSLKDGKYC